jgi:hypothetical protein
LEGDNRARFRGGLEMAQSVLIVVPFLPELAEIITLPLMDVAGYRQPGRLRFTTSDRLCMQMEMEVTYKRPAFCI